MLLYGSEVWGYENLEILERVHLQFCKRILNLRLSTPNFMVYGELGRHHLNIRVQLRMISFWCKLIQNENKLSGILYKLMFNLQANDDYDFRWISHIRSIFDRTSFGYISTNQIQVKFCNLKPLLFERLRDQFIQVWISDIENSSRGQFYAIFKTEFCYENYLSEFGRKQISKLRTSNCKMPIETGMWQNISREDRIRHLCREGVGHEYHYLFLCKNKAVFELIQKYIQRYYLLNPNINKMVGILSRCNVKLLSNIALFVNKLNKLF